MAAAGLQILAIALCVLGWIGTIITCILPQWKVSAFVGANIVTSQTTWKGIWMECVVQSTGQMQCKVYDSMLALSSDLQAARALMIVSILVGIFAMMLAVAGGKCTNCVDDERTKAKICVAGGVMFLIAGFLCIIPVCWTAHVIIREFNNPMFTTTRMEMGASLFIGWGSAALLIIGGGLLSANCPPKDTISGKAQYSNARPAPNYV